MALSALSRYRLRLSRGRERFGTWGLLRQALGRVFATNEVYVWYVLDLKRVVPIPFRQGYVLHRATADEAEWLHEVPAIPVDEGRRRIAEGEQLWFVLKDDMPVFACSAFVHVLPLEAARKGRYEFPKGVGCVDDAFTSPEQRGRAVAASAWMAIAERLRDEDGLEVLIAKVPEDNIPSRRTHEKTGFLPVSVMNRRRRGFKRRVLFRDEPVGEMTEPERRAAEHLKATVSR